MPQLSSTLGVVGLHSGINASDVDGASPLRAAAHAVPQSQLRVAPAPRIAAGLHSRSTRLVHGRSGDSGR